MTRATGERLYRACQRCRARKSRCDLNTVGELGRPPCVECFRAGKDCILAGSRRGGDYTRFRKSRSGPRTASKSSSQDLDATASSVEEPIECDRNEEPLCTELKNPFDALQILAKAAVHDPVLDQETVGIRDGVSPEVIGSPLKAVSHSDFRVVLTGPARGINDYELIRNMTLQPYLIVEMLEHYLANYHPFVPLAPKHFFSPLNIDEVANKEPFLLTVLLTIASKDNPKWTTIHQRCWEYTKTLLLDILLGVPSARQVGSVEGLLLLADWVPYVRPDKLTQSNTPPENFNIVEDSAAWSLIGQAVRQGYDLHLDRTSFREENSGDSKEHADRKRLAWTFVFVADRQISVRMGQSFWSRGPSLATRFTTSDFPALQPISSTEDDYASVIQATVELTQLIHNVHGILYSSKLRTLEMMQRGDYSRYLDDFLKSLMTWDHQWGDLKVSPKPKFTLRLMYEYLCLYVTAFSFQSILSRAYTDPSRITQSPQTTIFPRGIMSSPDGRFVFEAIRSAKMGLKTITEMDPVSDLRYMPSRFYLYGIYSAVFLNRADIFGALTMKEERDEILKLLHEFISSLETAATNEHHIGTRYSRLLKHLWFPDPVQRKLSDTEELTVTSDRQQPGLNNNISIDPTSVELFENSGEGIQVPAWVETPGFDPFCGSLSYFESDILGMLSQSKFDF